MAAVCLAREKIRSEKSTGRTENTSVLLPNGVSMPLRSEEFFGGDSTKEREFTPTNRSYYSRARHINEGQRIYCCLKCRREYKKQHFAVQDFPYIYDYVGKIHLTDIQKQLLLVRFTMIMDKVKIKLTKFTFWHTCTKTCLIVGNIMVPSVLSIEAFFFDMEAVRQIVFWFVWFLSIVIALISSLVTFCNTQKKYNLYNQFNTKIRREMWAFLTLSGRYMILNEHLALLGQQKEEFVEEDESITFDLGEKDEQNLVEESKENRENEDCRPPADLFEEVEFFNVDEVPQIMRQGHMLHFQSFMNRLETLYRYLTNSNIDIEVEDMSNLDYNNTIKRTAATTTQQRSSTSSFV